MPKLYPITLFYNTRFNTGNIPDSPARLAAFESKTFPSVHLRQDYGIAQVKLNATWPEVQDADYAMMEAEEGNTYWVIPNPPTMETDHTAAIDLVMDPLTTIGGIEAITVISGWANRAHVTDDTPFSNILPEPWAPSQAMQIKEYKVIHTGGTEGELRVAISLSDVSRAQQYKAQVWAASEEASEGAQVVTPTVPMPGYGGTQPVPTEGFTTTVEITATRDGTTETYSYVLPGLYAFDMSNATVEQGIRAAHLIGIDDIQAMYVLPLDDVTATPAPDVIYPGGEEKTVGMIAKLSGNSQQYTPGMPYKYYNVRNNKAYCLHNHYTVTSITSGDTNTFDAADLFAGGTEPDWVVQTDPSPTGTTYCSPTYYEGQPTHRLEQAVAGLPWLNASFTYTSGQGSSLGMMNARRQNANIDFNRDIANEGRQDRRIQSHVGEAVSALSGIASIGSGAVNIATRTDLDRAPSSIIGGIGQIAQAGFDAYFSEKAFQRDTRQANVNADFRMGDNLFSASVAQNVVAPQMAFPISVNAAAYYGNGFAVTHTTLRDNDVQRFDDFLSAYGYSRDTKFIKSMLSNRTKHNYIKTTGAMVAAEGFPRWLLDAIGAMFDAGVQIWHVKPSQEDLLDNPVRSN